MACASGARELVPALHYMPRRPGRARFRAVVERFCLVSRRRHPSHGGGPPQIEFRSRRRVMASARGDPSCVFRSYNVFMTLSPSLVGTLQAFNQMDPVARSGVLPVRDGAAFREIVGAMSPREVPPVRAEASDLQRPFNSTEAEILAVGAPRPAGHRNPKAMEPLGCEEETAVGPKDPASETSDEITKAGLDPYTFSPPKVPGMDLS